MLRKSSSASSLEDAGKAVSTKISTANAPSKRLSTRDFLANSSEVEEQQTWELVLASAAHDDNRITEKALDVVLLGHGDG